jgi:hypothetical protein
LLALLRGIFFMPIIAIRIDFAFRFDSGVPPVTR